MTKKPFRRLFQIKACVRRRSCLRAPILEILEGRALLSGVSYTFTKIDPPGAVSAWAYGISNNGKIVGNYVDASGKQHVFMKDGSKYTTYDLPDDFPSAINDSGKIVGTYTDSADGNIERSYLFDASTLTPISFPGAVSTFATGINDSGQIVGSEHDFETGTSSQTQDHGFLLNGSTYTRFDVEGPGTGDTFPKGISDAGKIVGQYGRFTGPVGEGTFDFLKDGAAYTMLDWPRNPLGYPSGPATGVNDSGQVVGYYFGATYHGLLLSGSTQTTLDFPGANATVADGINNSGSIVGRYVDATGGHAFLATASSLTVTGLKWNTKDGGVDFQYQIQGTDLSKATTVALYWASGTTFDTVIGNPIMSVTTQTAPGTYGPIHVTPAQLGKVPAGAKYLLAVADPKNVVEAADAPGKVASLPLPDLTVTSIQWHPDFKTKWMSDPTNAGGVTFTYKISGADLSQPAPIELYWATGPTTADEKGDAITVDNNGLPLETKTSQGEDTISISSADLGTPPPGTMDLLVVLDPPIDGFPNGKIVESDESNNFMALDASPESVLAGSVHVNVIGIVIYIIFTPENGDVDAPAAALTLNQATKIVGVDHFNWVQNVSLSAFLHLYVYYGTLAQTELPRTSLDPETSDIVPDQSRLTVYSDLTGKSDPLGARVNDQWEFYWNEDKAPFNYSLWQFPYGSAEPMAAELFDDPHLSKLLFGPTGPYNNWATFETQLVGVGPDHSTISLPVVPTITWKTNAVADRPGVPNSGGPNSVLADTALPPANVSGGISDVQISYLGASESAPVLFAIPDESIPEGTRVDLQATALAPTTGASLTYSLAPGAPSGARIDPKFGVITWVPTTPGPYQLTVRVANGTNPALITAQTFTVTVQDVAPTVTLGPNTSVTAGTILSRSGTFADPGSGSFSATVDYGDGTGVQPIALNPDKTFALTHTYATAGTFTAKVTVTDQFGGVGTGTLTVKVTSPTVTNPPRSGYGAGRDAFVTTLYLDELGRLPEPAGLRFWSRLLASGVKPNSVARTIWLSPERRALVNQDLAPANTFGHSYVDALRAWHPASQTSSVRPRDL
jgi:hypothetical protein